MKRLTRRHLDGVLLLDKPLGPSSNDALQRVRWLFAARKAGHGGTLDPLASGLLPIGFGEATKFINLMTEADKTYEAEIELGATSNTGDGEGVIEAVDPQRARAIQSAEIEATLAELTGVIQQRPPMYAALKHAGRPLYEYARKGIDIDRPARDVRIHAMVLLAHDQTRIRVRAKVSKGTYVRVLAETIGERLGTGAWLAGLRRTQVGPFALERAVSLGSIEQAIGVQGRAEHPALNDSDWICPSDEHVFPVDTMLEELPRIDLPAELAQRFAHGQSVSQSQKIGRYRVYAPDRFIGLGRAQDETLQPVRLVASQQ